MRVLCLSPGQLANLADRSHAALEQRRRSRRAGEAVAEKRALLLRLAPQRPDRGRGESGGDARSHYQVEGHALGCRSIAMVDAPARRRDPRPGARRVDGRADDHISHWRFRDRSTPEDPRRRQPRGREALRQEPGEPEHVAVEGQPRDDRQRGHLHERRGRRVRAPERRDRHGRRALQGRDAQSVQGDRRPAAVGAKPNKTTTAGPGTTSPR